MVLLTVTLIGEGSSLQDEHRRVDGTSNQDTESTLLVQSFIIDLQSFQSKKSDLIVVHVCVVVTSVMLNMVRFRFRKSFKVAFTLHFKSGRIERTVKHQRPRLQKLVDKFILVCVFSFVIIFHSHCLKRDISRCIIHQIQSSERDC